MSSWERSGILGSLTQLEIFPVILETISFHFTMRQPILDYEVLRKEDGTLTFDPVCIEQPHAMVFSFVRGDRNKSKVADFI